MFQVPQNCVFRGKRLPFPYSFYFFFNFLFFQLRISWFSDIMPYCYWFYLSFNKEGGVLQDLSLSFCCHNALGILCIIFKNILSLMVVVVTMLFQFQCDQGTPVSERAVPVAIFETDAGKFCY